jgi:hypothetical protein
MSTNNKYQEIRDILDKKLAGNEIHLIDAILDYVLIECDECKEKCLEYDLEETQHYCEEVDNDVVVTVCEGCYIVCDVCYTYLDCSCENIHYITCDRCDERICEGCQDHCLKCGECDDISCCRDFYIIKVNGITDYGIFNVDECTIVRCPDCIRIGTNN